MYMFFALVAGVCHRAFHLACLDLDAMPPDEEWYCPDCASGMHLCLYCGTAGKDVVGNAKDWSDAEVKKCCMGKCGRFYHREYVTSPRWCLRPLVSFVCAHAGRCGGWI